MMNRVLMLFLLGFLSGTVYSQLDTVRINDPAELPPIRDVFDGEGDMMPEFPGGEQEMIKWIMNNVSYPVAAVRDSIQGTVYVRFVVEKDGAISNSEILKSPADVLSEEVLRLVSIMPKWTPGMMNGEVVRTMYTLPVKFTL